MNFTNIQNSFDVMKKESGCQFELEPNITFYLEHLDVVNFLDIILGVNQTDLGHAQLAAWLITFWIMDDALENKAPNAIENAEKWIEWCSIRNEYSPVLRAELETWLEGTQEEHKLQEAQKLQEEHKLDIDYVKVRTKSAGVCPTIAAMFVFVPSRHLFFNDISVEDTQTFISKLRECSFLVGFDNDRHFKHGADINLSTSLSEGELTLIEHAANDKYYIRILEISNTHGLVAAKEAAAYRKRFFQWAKNTPRYK
jgi:hypothetical protein